MSRFGYRLAETARLWRNELNRRLRPCGLSQARWIILHYLSTEGDGLTQIRLADLVGIQGSTLVSQLDLLERAGLVERRDSAQDRRAKTIHLTPAATPVIDMIERVITNLRQEILLGIPDEQLQACIAVFDHAQVRLEHANADELSGTAHHDPKLSK